VTAADFRRIALSMPEAVEGAHFGNADFRVGPRQYIYSYVNLQSTMFTLSYWVYTPNFVSSR